MKLADQKLRRAFEFSDQVVISAFLPEAGIETIRAVHDETLEGKPFVAASRLPEEREWTSFLKAASALSAGGTLLFADAEKLPERFLQLFIEFVDAKGKDIEAASGARKIVLTTVANADPKLPPALLSRFAFVPLAGGVVA